MRRASRLLVLAVLITTLAAIVRQRGLGLHLGGAPVALQGPYATEESWIVGEIVRDITEMSAYPARSRGEVTVTDAPEAGRYRVSTSAAANAM